MSKLKVAKFGGSSLADAVQIRKVIEIIKADPGRKYIVVSAPGKATGCDDKITDLLYTLNEFTSGEPREKVVGKISDRFYCIIRDLGLRTYIENTINYIRNYPPESNDVDFLVSLGEYLCAEILAEALGYEFVDAADIVVLNSLGQCDMEATRLNMARLAGDAKGYVIPGFYGAMPNGDIKTFSRGGSDLSGAIIAALVDADVYENWTDVSGMRMTDPKIVPGAKRIDLVTYKELRELAYMGARVLHESVIFPLREAGIPIHLRNTNDPNDEGTLVVPDIGALRKVPGSVVGIAGRENFTVITIEKTLMNEELGFMRRVCSVFESNGVSIEHIPGGIDTLSVVVRSENVANGKLENIVREINEQCLPDGCGVNTGIALICIVGRAIAHTPGVAARLFQAIASANINVRMIDQGSSEMSIIVGVENRNYEGAIRAIYAEFA